MRELAVGFVPHSPLGRGFFTNALDVSALAPSDYRLPTHGCSLNRSRTDRHNSAVSGLSAATTGTGAEAFRP